MTCARNEIGYFHPEDNDASTDKDQNITLMRKMTKKKKNCGYTSDCFIVLVKSVPLRL